jgi:biotin carboxylase
MRKRWLDAGLAQPDFRLTNEAEQLPSLIQELGLPCVLKPRRSNGSKGVSVITELAEIAEAIKDAVLHAETFGFIVERFIEGPLLTADGFVDSDRVEVAALGDVETQAVSRFRVNTALNYPSNFPDGVVRRAKRLIHDAVRALGLVNSPFHCECIVSSREVMLVEIGARSGGSYLGSTVVPAVSGLVPSVVAARMLLGDRPSIRPKAAGGASLTFLEAPKGRLSAVTGLSEAAAMPGVLEAGVTLEAGQEGGAVASDNARHGYVVTIGRNREEAVARANEARNIIQFQMAGSGYVRS